MDPSRIPFRCFKEILLTRIGGQVTDTLTFNLWALAFDTQNLISSSICPSEFCANFFKMFLTSHSLVNVLYRLHVQLWFTGQRQGLDLE